ncbi:MAG TPA: ankyrin repeat domain-containing protein [Gammaproteobacteria bacterium]|nr:ankyrin repeat domain-containing protein [Gammaproteobacteria bacterium]
MTSQLPERASLEQLKKQAKSLLHGARAADPAALRRFSALPAHTAKSAAEIGALHLALHDAQSVIAREHGFKSWNELREHVEERSLSFAAAVDEFVRCATGGAAARALRLLALHPGIAHANLHTELALGDAEAVEARLRKNPEAATNAGGAQGWEPLLYVCHTFLGESAPARAEGLVATARGLLARGANPNAEYHWNWHRELPRTALWGALVATGRPRLAELLLEHGANPTDGVSMHIAAGSGRLADLDLLARFGVDVNGVAGGVPPLRYILSWLTGPTSQATGVRWLLEHGADPNRAWGELDDAPLHIAAQRCDVEMTQLLVRHGADIHRRRVDGRTPRTVAQLHGNRAVAAWLEAQGAKDELSALDRFVAACASGDRAGAEAMLAAQPELRGDLRPEHHLMVHVPAERGDAAVLETMLGCGFSPSERDRDGVTPLHRAAMAGRPEAVGVLLGHGASVNALDGMFAATPLVWAAQGWAHGQPPGADHVGAARRLVAAGSSLEWQAPADAPHPEQTQEQLLELARAAGAAARE